MDAFFGFVTKLFIPPVKTFTKQRLFLVPIPGYYFADNEALRGTTQQPRIATSDSLPGLPRDKQGTGGSALEKKPWRRQGPYA